MVSPVSASKKWNWPVSTASVSVRPVSACVRGSTRALNSERDVVGHQAFHRLVGHRIQILRGDARSVDREDDVRVGAELLEHRHLDLDLGQPRFGERRVLEALRPNPEDHPARATGPPPGRQRDAEACELDRAVGDVRLDEVHRGRADEGGDEEVDRMLVEVLRRIHLLDAPVAHHRHALAERHRLDLVVRHVDGRHSEPLVQPRELGAHAHAELGVEVRERLVHQERRRLAHDRPAHRHPLPLPSGERGGPPVEQVLEAEQLGDLADAAIDVGTRRLAHPQPVAEVLAHRHVRVERVVLEHHRDVAIARRELGDVAPADQDRPLGDVLEPGDHAHQGRLAAAGRADQHHELPARDLERDVVRRP